MLIENLNQTIISIPNIHEWPDLQKIIEHAFREKRKDWDIPSLICESITGRENDLLYTTLGLIQTSIILIDDMLDSDPAGLYHKLGHAETANIALTLHTLACSLIDDSSITSQKKVSILSEINNLQISTAFGQHLDNKTVRTEEDYWEIIKHKSRPFYQTAFKLGAILGDMPKDQLAIVSSLGDLFGEIIQFNDDLEDAFQKPANPDWERQGNNLILIFAQIAEHPHQKEFLELLPLAYTNDSILDEAQNILISSGSLSFLVYKVSEHYQQVLYLLDELDIHNKIVINDMFNDLIAPINILLNELGLEKDIHALI